MKIYKNFDFESTLFSKKSVGSVYSLAIDEYCIGGL